MIGLNHFLVFSGTLFCIGLFGALAKRSAIAILMGLEVMLTAVNINLVAISRYVTPEYLVGQVFAVFVIAVAAAEVAGTSWRPKLPVRLSPQDPPGGQSGT